VVTLKAGSRANTGERGMRYKLKYPKRSSERLSNQQKRKTLDLLSPPKKTRESTRRHWKRRARFSLTERDSKSGGVQVGVVVESKTTGKWVTST